MHKVSFFLVFYIVMKTGLLYSGKNQAQGFKGQGTKGVILASDRGSNRRQEKTILRSFMIWSPRQTLFGR